MADARIEEATLLMKRFADRTGLSSTRPSRRYLWTDAFAVCNFLGLGRATNDATFERLALDLVDRVHSQLGRHRGDDGRRGWISGLREAEGRAHPTVGGLRIGKPLPERREDEPFDPELEWDRDGQYFHYLTQWVHALDQATRATSRIELHVFARELAEAAQRAFTIGPPGRRRMCWKRSIDLSRALVPSTGQHDPLDGLVVCRELDATADALGVDAEPRLDGAIDELASLVDVDALATHDPLGLGGLLVDAQRLAIARPDDALVASILEAAHEGLRWFDRDDLRAPAAHRLAFRELGLAIGLGAVSQLAEDATLDPRVREGLDALAPYAGMRDEIEDFWRAPAHQHVSSFREHEDIDEVMLATALLPVNELVLPPPALVRRSSFEARARTSRVSP